MALSGLWKMLRHTNIILTTYGTIGCAESDNWCEMVWHLIIGEGPHMLAGKKSSLVGSKKGINNQKNWCKY